MCTWPPIREVSQYHAATRACLRTTRCGIQHTFQKHQVCLLDEACTSMTDFSISGLMRSLSLSLYPSISLSLLVKVGHGNRQTASPHPFQLNAIACKSNTISTTPQMFCQPNFDPTLTQFNDWGFSWAPRRRISRANLPSKQLRRQYGRMGHADARGPGNLSPKTPPQNHRIKMGHCNTASASVIGLCCVTA